MDYTYTGLNERDLESARLTLCFVALSFTILLEHAERRFMGWIPGYFTLSKINRLCTFHEYLVDHASSQIRAQMKDLLDILIFLKQQNCSQSQTTELQTIVMSNLTPPVEASPSRTGEYEQGFAAGVKDSEKKKRAQEEKIKEMIEDLKKNVKSFEEKLDAMSKWYNTGGTVGKKPKKIIKEKRESGEDPGRNKKCVEREFGAHIGRFGHWV